jgi:hypothetical protein
MQSAEPFMNFLKKKAFEEFKIDKLIDDKVNYCYPDDMVLHKTPVTPWGDGKVLPQALNSSAQEFTNGGPGGSLSRAKGNKGLMNFFNKEHHEQVINTYGGFSTGMHELKKAKKHGNKTQDQPDVYSTLFDDENDSRGANQTGG